MTLGIGCDIVEIARIEEVLKRFKESFLKRVLSSEEEACAHGPLASFVAGRFAAKEACAKALGTGFAQGISMRDLRVINDCFGAPKLIFAGEALNSAKKLGVTNAFVSISHERRFAIAYVLLEGTPPMTAPDL